ncbi:MAG: polysaccharide biosynthesis tyrosine autokinase [Phycisphaerae bacterium]|nr:polysaccharide biosynthesis tyrosine autokinase [Phycisphaerae bacterium]
MTTLPTHDRAPSIVAAGRTPLSTMQRPGGPAGGGRGGLTGRDVMRIIRKHLWLIAILLVVFTTASVVGTKFWLRYSPTYESMVRLSITPPRVNVWAPDAKNVAADLDILKQSYVNLAKIESVLRRAINEDKAEDGRNRDRIRKTSYFTGDLNGTVSLLKDELSVSAIRDTNLIQISLAGPKREELPEVINAVADSLVYQSIAASKQNRAGRMKSLNVRLDELKSAIAARQKSIEQIRGASEVPLLIERRNITQMSLQSLTTELTQLRLLKAQAETALEAVQEQHRSGTLSGSLEVLQALDQDAPYRSLVVSQKNIEIELESYMKRLLPGHRRVKATQARLDTIEAKRAKMEADLVKKQIQAMVQQQQSQVTAVSERLLAVGNQYNEVSASLKDLGVSLTKISSLEAQITRLQDSATQVDNALLQLRIALDDIPIAVRALGEIPDKPSFPKYIIMVPVGVLLGLGLGLGLAFLMELMDTSIKSSADLSAKIDLPLLGMVPHEDDMDEEIPDMRTLMLTNSDSLGGEAYRQIRTSLLFGGPTSQRRSLMVTSPSPGDGRTAVTMNLATSIAQGGRRVLVVDTNFRQPSLSNLFPQASPSGLVNALVGQGRWEDNVYEVEKNLSIMTAGPLPPNPAELLGGEHMRTIVGEMTAKYDQVLFDAAPALVVTDPAVLSTIVDGVIIVIRAGTSTQGVLQRTRDIFLRVGAHVIGSVLNCVRITAGGYLKRNYSTFYEYRGQQLPAATGRPTPRPPLPPEPSNAGGDIALSQQNAFPDDMG